MIYGIQGTSVTVNFVFPDSSGNPTIPDANTATYSIRLNDGTLDPDYTDVAIDLGVTDTYTNIVLADTAIDGQVETRTIVVSYQKAAITRTLTQIVRLVQFPRHWLTPDDVRAFLGVNASELPDSDIDLHRAYMEAQDAVGAEALATAFSSTTTDAIKANDLVMCRAALNVFPSLELRIAQSESNGTKTYARLTKLNLDRLYTYISGMYSDLLGVIGSVETVAPVLLVLSTQADPITGV